jgi:hypothetical protein
MVAQFFNVRVKGGFGVLVICVEERQRDGFEAGSFGLVEVGFVVHFILSSASCLNQCFFE